MVADYVMASRSVRNNILRSWRGRLCWVGYIVVADVVVVVFVVG